MRDEVLWVGRLLFSLVFIGSGVGHLTQTEGSAQYAEYKKVPNAKLMVQLTGVLMILGGAAVILGIWIDLAGLCIAVLALVYGFVMHRFWEVEDPMAQAAERAQFMKNVSIAGAGLIIAAVSVYWPYTLTDGVFKP